MKKLLSLLCIGLLSLIMTFGINTFDVNATSKSTIAATNLDIDSYTMQTITDGSSYYYLDYVSAIAYVNNSFYVSNYNDYDGYTDIIEFDMNSLNDAKINIETTLTTSINDSINKFTIFAVSPVDTNMAYLNNSNDLIIGKIGDDNRFEELESLSGIIDFYYYNNDIYALHKDGNQFFIDSYTATISGFGSYIDRFAVQNPDNQGNYEPYKLTFKNANKSDIGSSQFYMAFKVKNNYTIYSYNNDNNEPSKYHKEDNIYNNNTLVNVDKLTFANDVLFYQEGSTLRTNTNKQYNSQFYTVAGSNTILSINSANGVSYLDRLTKDLSNSTAGHILKSESREDGFFSSPVAVISRMNNIYVADDNNNRTVKISDAQYTNYVAPEEQKIANMLGLAVDRVGNQYILNDYGRAITKIYVDSGNVEIKATNKMYNGIAIDANDTLYAYTDNSIDKINIDNLGVYHSIASAEFTTSKIIDIYENYDKSGLYILQENNNVLKYDASNGSLQVVLTTLNGDNPQSIAIDAKENIFVIYKDGTIFKYTNDSGSYTPTIAKNLGLSSITSVDLSISSADITTKFAQNIGVGDMLVIDKSTHSLNLIYKQDLQVEVYDNYDNDYDIMAEETAEREYADHNEIIYETLTQTSIYNLPFESSSSIAVLKKGTTVIMLRELLEDRELFAYVMIDKEGKLIAGYIIKSAIAFDPNYVYSASYNNSARVYNGGANLYKYPTLLAPKLNRSKHLIKDSAVTLLPFTDYDRGSSVKWRRVMYKDEIGYVLANNLYSESYIEESTMKKPNATIVFIDNSSVVVPLSARTIKPLASLAPFANGTRITVLSWFNPTSQYTTIQYINSNDILVTCLIESKYIDYDGVSTLQATALISSVVLLPLIIILAYMYYKYCKRRQTAIPAIYTSDSDAMDIDYDDNDMEINPSILVDDDRVSSLYDDDNYDVY